MRCSYVSRRWTFNEGILAIEQLNEVTKTEKTLKGNILKLNFQALGHEGGKPECMGYGN